MILVLIRNAGVFVSLGGEFNFRSLDVSANIHFHFTIPYTVSVVVIAIKPKTLLKIKVSFSCSEGPLREHVKKTCKLDILLGGAGRGLTPDS